MEEKRGNCGSLVDQNRHLTNPVDNVLRRTIGATVHRLGHRVEKGDPGFDDLTVVIRPSIMTVIGSSMAPNPFMLRASAARTALCPSTSRFNVVMKSAVPQAAKALGPWEA